MAYTIFNTRNNELAVVEDGTIDNTTDLKLIGKNYAGYGEIQNENFIYLLENFAGANQPPRPIGGQLWFDTSDKKIKVYDGNDENVFVPLGNVHIGALPTGNAINVANVNKGDLWWDDVTSQLYAHNGATTGDPFVLIGPKGSQDVKTIIEDATVFDSLYTGQADPAPYQHKILKAFVNDEVVFVVSNDEFTLDDSNAINGFDRIKKGITLINTQNANNGVTSDNFQFHGSASDALRLGGTLAAEFIQRSNPTFITEVEISDNDGLLIGNNNQLQLSVNLNEPIIQSSEAGAALNIKAADTGGSIVTPAQFTYQGIFPSQDAASGVFNLGSTTKRWNEIHAVSFKGIAEKADTLLSNGQYRTADRGISVDTVVTRDSVGDIFGNAFRGTGLYNSADASAAVTGRVTRADGVQVDGTSNYVNASVATTADKLVMRDSSGNVNATQFNGLATRAATVEVPTGGGNFEYRSASVANSGSDVPNSVAIRDANGSLWAREFIGNVNGTSGSAGAWTSPITITLAGDASGQVSFDGSSDETLTVTVTNNSVALGTDTTGNYVQSIAKRPGAEYINVFVDNVLDGVAGESRSVQISLDADSTNQGGTLVARDQYGSFTANDITADGDIEGTVITATTKFVGAVNESGTTKDGYFNNLYCNNFNFANEGTLGIDGGGTGATTAAGARTNLDIYSTSEIDTLIDGLNSDIDGISSDRIVSSTSSAIINDGSMVLTIGGNLHSTYNSSGITLSQGEFVGTATSAEFADLAEKYSTAEELPNGTVVTVGRMPGHEVDPVTKGDIAIGVVSTDPAFKMNSEAEGQYIGLKGRLPVRVIGAVRKGDAVYVDDNGCASTVINGGSMVGIALETVSVEEEKLVECVLKV